MQLVQTQLQKVEWYQDSVDDSDKIAALEGEFLALQETADANLQLSQLGMAIEIINHEFINNGGTIPRLLPASTLACPPSSTYIR